MKLLAAGIRYPRLISLTSATLFYHSAGFHRFLLLHRRRRRRDVFPADPLGIARGHWEKFAVGTRSVEILRAPGTLRKELICGLCFANRLGGTIDLPGTR